MGKDWEDGPDDENEPPLPQRDLLDATIAHLESIERHRFVAQPQPTRRARRAGPRY
jgi:hypothetical protein